MIRTGPVGLCAILLSCVSGQATAQDPAATKVARRPVVPGTVEPVYPAEFFAATHPQTALDMLNRTPGFTLAEGSFVRGFGGAAGNVLIDGQRPTVKTGGLTEVLRRIPASRVERIVLLRGGDAAEAQGQMLVANVVLKAAAGGSGTATLEFSHTADGRISPTGRVSYARKLGGWQTSIELSAEELRYPSRALYRLRDASGALAESWKERTIARSPEFGLALSASRQVAGGTLTLNGRLGKNLYEQTEYLTLFRGDVDIPPYGTRELDYVERFRFGELGLDWTRNLGSGWTTKLVGLGRIERSKIDQEFREGDFREVSSLRQKPAEMVGRVTFSREGKHKVRPEIGMELAWNGLRSTLDYAQDMGGGPEPVDLSGSRARVIELRGEAFANLVTRLSRKFSLETGIALEISRIRVTGDAASSQSLTYLKPSAALVWTPSGATEIRVGFRRTVDQLDFGDFAASVDQGEGRPIGGNAELRPARLTRFYLRADHRWGKGAAVSAEFFHQTHDGLLGYIVLPSGDQALGSIGNGRQWGITTQATLPLDGVLKGAQLKLDGTLRDSRVTDPLTGEARRVDDLSDITFNAEFRHDVLRLKSAWGIRYFSSEDYTVSYVGERLRSRSFPVWIAYIETTVIGGFKAVLTAKGLAGERGFVGRRRFYEPTIADDFIGSQRRRFTEGAVVTLTLTKSL